MADTPDEWRAERGGERADGPDGPVAGWLDDRGVSEVIGSILVFGLLVSLLAIVQTQAVPNANNEVEVKHSDNVQGDMANLQAAITRTSAFGGTESTVVETGMTYPSRLVLYNPPAVQGTLRTSAGSTDNFVVAGFGYGEASGGSVPIPEDSNRNAALALLNDPTYSTHLVSYEANYNRYDDSPTIRYEHGTLVSDFEDGATVQSQGSLVNGKRISLTYLSGNLEESQVRPASVTTYPVSAPGQTVKLDTGDSRGVLRFETNIPEEVWVGEILTDQIDMDALPGEDVSTCGELQDVGSNPADDGRFIVDCAYGPGSGPDSPNVLELEFEEETTYSVQMSKVGFRPETDELEPTYVTTVPNANPGSITVEVRDKFGNPIDRSIDVEVQTSQGRNTESTTADGRLTVDDVTGSAAVFLTSGPNAYSPSSGTPCSNSAGCVAAQGRPPLTRSAVTVTDVGAVPSEGEYVVGFFNEKDSGAEIEQVQLDYVTQREQRTLTLSADALVGGITGDEQEFSASFVSDGPDSIQSVTVDGTTYEPVDPSGSPTGAKENLAPVEFREDGDEDGDLVTLAANSGTVATFTLNEQFSLEDSDSVDIAITVYYADGSQATYTRTLFNNAGEEGQTPPST